MTSIGAVVMKISLVPSTGARIGITLLCWSTGELLNGLDDGVGVLHLLCPGWIHKDNEPMVQAS